MRDLEDVEEQLTMFKTERVELQRSCMQTQNVLEHGRITKVVILEKIEFLTQKLDKMEVLHHRGETNEVHIRKGNLPSVPNQE